MLDIRSIFYTILITYGVTLAGVLGVFWLARGWVTRQPEASDRVIRAALLICMTVTIVFGGLAASVVILITLGTIGLF